MNFSENMKQVILKTGKFLWQDFVAFGSKYFCTAHSAMKGGIIMFSERNRKYVKYEITIVYRKKNVTLLIYKKYKHCRVVIFNGSVDTAAGKYSRLLK